MGKKVLSVILFLVISVGAAAVTRKELTQGRTFKNRYKAGNNWWNNKTWGTIYWKFNFSYGRGWIRFQNKKGGRSSGKGWPEFDS